MTSNGMIKRKGENMSKAKRLLDILLFVNAKRKFTAQELADEFKISVRTVHRDLLDLSDMGLPIYAEQGRNGGYTVITTRLLPPMLFTEEEVVSIFFAFQALNYYRDLPFDAEIRSVTHKLYRSLPKDAQAKVDKLRSYIAFWNPKRTIDTPLLKNVLDASIEGSQLHIQYHSKKAITTKHIRPIGVYAHNGLWYMPAYDFHKDKVLLFRVDRIHAIISSIKDDSNFTNLEEWFDSYEVKTPIRLLVELSKEGVRQCLSEPNFQGFVTINEHGTGTIDAVIDEGELHFIAPLFYRLGLHAKIIEPEELIQHMRKQAKEILTIYQEGNL